MHILPPDVEAHVRGRIVAVLTGQAPPEPEDRVMPARHYRAGRRSGREPSDPTGCALTDAEDAAEEYAAWAAVIEAALATLEPRAADVLRSMWATGQPREFAAYVAGCSVPEVFVWEQQAIARAALRAAIDGLISDGSHR